MVQKETIFNNRKRRLRRTRVSWGEAAFGAFVLCLLVGTALWLAAQGDNYDPAERDIATELLASNAAAEPLYHAPLVRWADPAKGAAGGAGAPDLGAFPPAILEGGWQAASRVQEFSPETLYEKINGAADQFLQYGFEKLHFVAIHQPESGLEMNVEAYDMGAFKNALGIFTAQKDAKQGTTSAATAHFYPTKAGAMGVFDTYYVKLTGSRSEPAAQEKAAQLVAALAAMAGTATEPPIGYRVMNEHLGIPFDGISYERTDVFQFAFAKDFWFGHPEPGAGLQYFFHESENAETAQALFAKLMRNNRYDYTVLEETEAGAIMKHQFLDAFAALYWRGKLVYGIEDADERAALDAALQPLREAIANVEEH